MLFKKIPAPIQSLVATALLFHLFNPLEELFKNKSVGSAVHLNNSAWQKTSEKAQVSQLEQTNALLCGTWRKLRSYMLIQVDIRIDSSLRAYILTCLRKFHSSCNNFFGFCETSRFTIPHGWEQTKLKALQTCVCMWAIAPWILKDYYCNFSCFLMARLPDAL